MGAQRALERYRNAGGCSYTRPRRATCVDGSHNGERRLTR